MLGVSTNGPPAMRPDPGLWIAGSDRDRSPATMCLLPVWERLPTPDFIPIDHRKILTRWSNMIDLKRFNTSMWACPITRRFPVRRLKPPRITKVLAMQRHGRANACLCPSVVADTAVSHRKRLRRRNSAKGLATVSPVFGEPRALVRPIPTVFTDDRSTLLSRDKMIRVT